MSDRPEPESPASRSAGDDLATRSINTVRTLAMDAVEQAKSGHPGTPMALAPLAYALFAKVLAYDPGRPDWPDRDRFVLSCGHASLLLYSMLYLTGYGLELEEIESFRQWGSRTPGHPEHGIAPGIETTTGPLGQGFANAVGMALAERMLAARYNRPDHEVIDHRTWAIASDGDLMEGISQEAASLAGHLGLAKLCVFYDDNHITIDGSTDLAFTEDVETRFLGYGWRVIRLGDTATPADYVAAAERARAEAACPTLVICRTHIGYGAPNKHDTAAAHGSPLGADEVRAAKKNLGWPEDAKFFVPPDVLEHMRELGRRGAKTRAAWEARRAAHRDAHPELAAQLDRVLAGRLPVSLDDAWPSFEAGRAVATRKRSHAVLNAIKDALPELVGGSADLTVSNGTELADAGAVSADSYEGRNLHFGVREHAMGGILNGMALHGGLRPYGGTFLVFSDYMRPSIRLAALMGVNVTYVFTHDSIGLGEDGPTHQPIEQLAALRAIPDLRVIRPADGAETTEAWRVAVERGGPTALVLTRQKVPELARGDGALASASGLARGAYVLNPEVEDPEVSFLATGSEVQHALAAARILSDEGVRARVVSFPCWSLFEERPREEQERVLGPDAVRVAVEAAASFGWHRWVGSRGALVTIDRFGASAPGDRMMREMGFTAENVARVAREALAAARAPS